MLKEQREHDAKVRAEESKRRDQQMANIERKHQERLNTIQNQSKKRGFWGKVGDFIGGVVTGVGEAITAPFRAIGRLFGW